MNKKGISEVIVSIIMIALVMGLIAIVWAFSTTFVKERLEVSGSCFGNYGEIQINKQYTCYDSSNDEVQVSVSVWNAEIDGVLVSVSGVSGSKSFEIKSGSSYSYVKKLGGVYGESLNPPEKNSGVTYIVDAGALSITDADIVKIAPIIEGNQCDVSDTADNIGDCSLLA
ncbi:hypothetical protein J4407_02340 [Candidatus Pacearchaeota archaeon]|nr:hypothetical protein [Candidatus Pacearchaeota archaeon]